MRIIHRISLTADSRDQREISRLGISVAPMAMPGVSSSPFVWFDIEESDSTWPAVRDWVARRRPSNVVRTLFSKNEISAARFLALAPDWHHGYPQPRDGDNGYLEATYDLTDYCAACGMGLKQKAPFQMKGEPRWGRRGILQLNWVFDEYFVTPAVWTAVFEPHGIGRRAVIDRSGRELQSVVQLVVAEEVGMVTTGLMSETCTTCGRVKYLPISRGALPPLANEPLGHIVWSREYFGSGASTHHEVIVSQHVRSALEAAHVRGASFVPVAEGSTGT